MTIATAPKVSATATPAIVAAGTGSDSPAKSVIRKPKPTATCANAAQRIGRTYMTIRCSVWKRPRARASQSLKAACATASVIAASANAAGPIPRRQRASRCGTSNPRPKLTAITARIAKAPRGSSRPIRTASRPASKNVDAAASVASADMPLAQLASAIANAISASAAWISGRR